MTVAEAYKAASLSGGGAILAIKGCNQSNWDETIACSGFSDSIYDYLTASQKFKALNLFSSIRFLAE